MSQLEKLFLSAGNSLGIYYNFVTNREYLGIRWNDLKTLDLNHLRYSTPPPSAQSRLFNIQYHFQHSGLLGVLHCCQAFAQRITRVDEGVDIY